MNACSIVLLVSAIAAPPPHPASATTSFFIVTFDTPALDGKYTAFAGVIEGLEVVDRIERTPVAGEAPTTRIDLLHARVVK